MGDADLGGRRLGGFELSELLGSGAFGSVWRARQLRLGRDVAVKVLDPGVARNPDAARRFEREGRAAAALDHPGIVPIYEAGEDDGLVYLAMRLIDGETLADRLDRDGHLDAAAVMATLAPVAAALDHAHERGLVHRDVKPSNILLDADRVWLADFGIAASTQEMGRYTTGAIGTAEYMAPEQATSQGVDHRADLYALGCVTFHCVTGRPPYVGDELMPVLMAHVNEPVPTTGHDGLDRFFATALAKHPDDRFDSGAALIGGLGPAVGTQPSVPSPSAAVPSTGPATPRDEEQASQRRWLVAGAAVLLIPLVIGLAVVWLTNGSDGDELVADADQDAAATSDEGRQEPIESGADGGTGADADDGAVATGNAIGGSASSGSNLPMSTLNPHSNFGVEPVISGHVLPVLVRVNSDFTLRPDLATDIPTLDSTDPLVVRWTLRDDAVWDDGSPITAADVEATYRYLVADDTAATGTFFYEQIESFDIVSPTEFTVTFVEPIGAWRVLFSTNHPIIQAAAYDAHLAEGGTAADFLEDGRIEFSGGPYRVTGFEVDDEVRLRRNDAYWGEAGGLDQVTIRTFSSGDDQVEALRAGDVEVIDVSLPAATEIAAAEAVDGVTVASGLTAITFEVQFNTRRAPFDDVRVRQAVANAIDRDAMVRTLVDTTIFGASEPLQSIVYVPQHPDYAPVYEGYPDTAEGARLLQAAGWTLEEGRWTRDGAVLAVEVGFRNTTVDEINGEQLFGVVNDQLDAFGIEVVRVSLPTADFLALRQTGEFEMNIDFTVANNDPSAVDFRFGSRFCPATVEGCDGDMFGFNFGGYSNETVDQLLARADVTADESTRADLFRQVDTILAAEVPALPLYQAPAFVAHVDDLANVDASASRGGPLASLDKWAYVIGLD